MLIAFRGLARVLVRDESLGDFPAWVTDLGQKGLIGPVPLSLILFAVLLALLGVLLHRTGFGRQVVVIGTNAEVARFSGVNVARVKTVLFLMSGTVSALAGLLYAARLGSVRGDSALGFELDIITMVLLGGVSIFGGKGSMTGVLLSILIILNLRNGMALMSITGHIQTGVIGVLLIGSVLVPWCCCRSSWASCRSTRPTAARRKRRPNWARPASWNTSGRRPRTRPPARSRC
jgi:rhamnose transport system permease protein